MIKELLFSDLINIHFYDLKISGEWKKRLLTMPNDHESFKRFYIRLSIPKRINVKNYGLNRRRKKFFCSSRMKKKTFQDQFCLFRLISPPLRLFKSPARRNKYKEKVPSNGLAKKHLLSILM